MKTKDEFMNMRQQGEEYNQATALNTKLTLAPKSILDLTSEGIRVKSQQIVDYYTDGYNNPAEGLILAKKLTEMAEQIKSNLQDSASNELKLGKGDKAELFGCVITEQMVGVRYDFSNCGDKTYNDATKIVKEREAYLKTVKGEQITGDPTTGEVWSVKEPVKSGKMCPVIKIL